MADISSPDIWSQPFGNTDISFTFGHADIWSPDISSHGHFVTFGHPDTTSHYKYLIGEKIVGLNSV